MSLHERHGCECDCGSGWDEPAARRELGETVARIRSGVKRPTTAMRAPRAGSGTSFQAYARRWLQAKTEGAFGEIRAGTAAGYAQLEQRVKREHGESFDPARAPGRRYPRRAAGCSGGVMAFRAFAVPGSTGRGRGARAPRRRKGTKKVLGPQESWCSRFDFGCVAGARKPSVRAGFRWYGATQIRTGDTTIFSF